MSSMHDDWRLTVSFRDSDEMRKALDALLGLELEGHMEFEERFIVSHEGSQLMIYGDSEEALGQARELVDEVLSKHGLGAIVTASRWHPIEQLWEDASLPLPRTDEEREEERRVRLDRETARSLETGYAEWEVRVELPNHDETARLAARLESGGIPVVRRHTFLLAGAANEDEAIALADRLREEAPASAEIQVEPGGQMVWEVAPTNPFAIFSGLGSDVRRLMGRGSKHKDKKS